MSTMRPEYADDPGESASPFARPPGEVSRRRIAPPPRPSMFASIDWTDIRRKVWHAGLIVASAYVSAKPEKYGWLMPVLTAVAGTSAPPTGSPKAAMAMVLVIMFAVSAARAAVWAF